MTDLFENPMGLNGFEFVEFASPTPGVLEETFDLLWTTFAEFPGTSTPNLKCHARQYLTYT